MSEKDRSRIVRHLRKVGAYVAGTFWLAFVYGAWVLISSPETGRHSHLAGWGILIVAIAIMIATLNHWVKYLPVIFGGFILGGLLALASGHLLNNRPFPRILAAGLTALFIGCSLISRTLAERELKTFDRLALVAFLVAFVGGLVKETVISGVIGLSLGFCCLLVAWAHNRWSAQNRRVAGP